MKYILDTNIITALIKGEASILAELEAHRSDGVYLCQPVYFESMRGLLWKKAEVKIAALQKLRARLGWLQLLDADWEQAGQLWVYAVSKGKQLADVDLLIAAIAVRQDAVIVTSDKDFDVLPVRRENWRV